MLSRLSLQQENKMRVIVEQIAASIFTTENELFELAKARLKKIRAFANFKDFHIYKRSIDARKKENIKIGSLVFSC